MSVVEQYYDINPQVEWERLERHPMELALTLRAFDEYLPPAPAHVLDVGGGPGRYAITLAQRQYTVTLFDLSPANLTFAQEKARAANVILTDYIRGNALDLNQFADTCFDAVLLMGPLYHLLTLEERQQAIAEAWRVLRPGGMCFAAFIGRYAAFLEAALRDRPWIVEQSQECDKLIQTGIRTPPPHVFAPAYFAHPTEVTPLMENAGFKTRTVIAAEGITTHVNDELYQTASAELIQAWVNLNYRLAKDPSIHGAAMHLLYIGQK